MYKLAVALVFTVGGAVALAATSLPAAGCGGCAEQSFTDPVLSANASCVDAQLINPGQTCGDDGEVKLTGTNHCTQRFKIAGTYAELAHDTFAAPNSAFNVGLSLPSDMTGAYVVPATFDDGTSFTITFSKK